MTRRILPTLALLGAFGALTGCNHDDGLTARGSVIADVGGTRTGFSFPDETRIDQPDAGGALGLITGSCEMGRVAGADGSEQWGIVVEIRRGSTVDDLGLDSVTIMQRTDAEPTAGRVEAQLGTAPYTSGSAGCTLEIAYAVEDGGMVGLTGGCDVADESGANSATVAVDLDLAGCTVIR